MEKIGLLYVGVVALMLPGAWVDGFSMIPPTPTRTSNVLQMAASSSSQDLKKRGLVVDEPERIRNVALVGHSHSGKTALAEWMLYEEHVITKKPTSGESALDSDPIEAARHSSVFSHFCRVPHRGALIEVSDTPWGDFPSDALAALDGADSAIVVVSAADGVQTGTLHSYQHCQSVGIPVMLALSKMDRPFLQLAQVMSDIEESLATKPVPLQVYKKDGDDNFAGVVPLFITDETTGELRKNDGASEMIETEWIALEEAVAMTDDDLLVDYLENGVLEVDQVINGLRVGVKQGKILPVVFTSAERDLGVSELMDAIVGVLPNPIEMRDEAIRKACENEAAKCDILPGVESGFAARVLHTIVDSFGSLSVMRVISNSRNNGGEGPFESLPHETVNLRTGEKVKMPSVSTSFSLCGKERLSLADGAHVIPGDVIAVPKLPETVCTNDVLVVPNAVEDEKEEIIFETTSNVLTPLSRPVQDTALMTSATVEFDNDSSGKNSKGKSSGNDDKLISALRAMSREDLSLRIENDQATGKLLVHCMSQDHLQLITLRLKERYDLDVTFGRPPVQYRETLKKAVKNVEGRHKKQSGGSGQFGVCYIDMEPLEEGSGIEFESQIKGGVISKPFIGSVEKGVREQLKAGGPLGGFPVTDVRVTLVDGKMHSVDSKDVAFQSAGRLAVKAALEKGGCKLLQPMERVVFQVGEKLQGEITAIVARHEGYVTSSCPSDNGIEITAIIPGAVHGEVSDVLRAATAGEAQFTSEFSHYQAVPDSVVNDILKGSSEPRP